MQYWYRLNYSKRGKAAFLSHLDTIRIFERSMRRSGLDIGFTSGFNPRIRFSAPSALPVGLAVRNEALAVSLNSEHALEEVAGAVNRQLPEGFRIEGVDRVREVTGPPEELVFEIRHGGPGESALRAVEAWRSRDRIEVSRMRDGGTVVIDIKPYLGAISVNEEEIVVRIRTVNGALPRMSDLLKAFYTIPGDEDGAMEIHEITRL